MFDKTLTAKCDTKDCQSSVSLDTTEQGAANDVLKANGWMIDGYSTHTCPWCLKKGVINSAKGDTDAAG